MLSDKLKKRLEALIEMAFRGVSAADEGSRNEAKLALEQAKKLCAKYDVNFDKEWTRREASEIDEKQDDTIGMGKVPFTYADIIEWSDFQVFCVAVSNIVSCRVIFSSQQSFVAVCGSENDVEAFKLCLESFINKLNLFYPVSRAKEMKAYSSGFSYGLLSLSEEMKASQQDSSDHYQIRGNELIIISDKLARIDSALASLRTQTKPIDERKDTQQKLNNPKDMLSFLLGRKDGQTSKHTRL